MTKGSTRGKPFDPAERERQRALEAASRESKKAQEAADAERLAAERANRIDVIHMIQDQPGETRISATSDAPHRRLDVFSLMRERKAITGDHELAVRRLQDDIAQARPILGISQIGDRVQSTLQPEESASQAFRRAKARVEAMDKAAKALAAVGDSDGLLMTALVVPLASGALTRWRYTVERITGETNDHAQGARIRSACQRLMEHYRALDNAPRRSSVTVYLGEMISRAEEAA
jgi:hypothetical protein